MDGLGVVRTLQGHAEATKIVVLTRHDDDAYVPELMSAGTAAYVLKQSGRANCVAVDRDRLSNKEIASALKISVRTVEVHKTNGLRKLRLVGRVDIVRYGLYRGWIKDP